jgi:hypothetical protein
MNLVFVFAIPPILAYLYRMYNGTRQHSDFSNLLQEILSSNPLLNKPKTYYLYAEIQLFSVPFCLTGNFVYTAQTL